MSEAGNIHDRNRSSHESVDPIEVSEFGVTDPIAVYGTRGSTPPGDWPVHSGEFPHIGLPFPSGPSAPMEDFPGGTTVLNVGSDLNLRLEALKIASTCLLPTQNDEKIAIAVCKLAEVLLRWLEDGDGIHTG